MYFSVAGLQGGCIICAMAKTLISSQQTGAQAIKPHLVYTKLRLVCKHLILGQQEDAHEFLRYLMEAMEKAYLSRIPKSSQLDQYSKETTPINQILGGYLKTSVRCLACGHESVTFQHFEDLLLDIRKANTLEEALDLYFARERLEDMGYKCESCKKKVSATKQFSLERAPISLCIQLKRFSIVGNKLNKHITIRQQLNLSKYSSRKNAHEPLQYRLVSMVTHLGASQHCGHYTAIGLTETGSYYQFDDSFVRQISLQNVLNTNAYIIFYELDTSADKGFLSIGSMADSSSNSSSSRLSVNDDRMARSFLDTKETPRNNVTTTVTSGSTTKPFIGPMLPSKLSIETNENSSYGLNDNGKESILSHKTTNNNNNHNNNHNNHKKTEHSPIVKLTSNGARYVNHGCSDDTNTESTTNKFVQNNGYLHITPPNRNNDSSSDEDDDHEDDDDVGGGGDGVNRRKKSFKGDFRRSKEQTLPSMPKLEATESTNHNDKSHLSSNSFKPRSLPNGSAKTMHTNGKQHRATNDGSNSDSSCDDTIVKSCTKNTLKTNNSTPILHVNGNNNGNGNSNNKHTPNRLVSRLVPYDDSEYDSGTESPPEVKTKAGPFQVTNTNTPPVVASFMKSSVERSKSKTPSPARAVVNHGPMSNGAKLLCGRRESDSNMIVKTAASSANSNKRPNEWHGNETAHKLLKLNHRGYGASVSTWSGQKSTMEKVVSYTRTIFINFVLNRENKKKYKFHDFPYLFALTNQIKSIRWTMRKRKN